MTLSQQKRIALASGNQGKIKEIQAILAEHPIIPQSQFDTPEADETGATFVENALLKARNAALHCNLPAIADDSGLVVDALDGAPGIISARYAGVGASDQENLLKLLRDLQTVPDKQRTARFVCVIVFLEHPLDPCPLVAYGEWHGIILRQSVGNNGFGYDPIFWVPEKKCSSAELTPEIKNSLSHRCKALNKLTELLQERFPII
jgi:XTP/dITP diphosphohydrolase